MTDNEIHYLSYDPDQIYQEMLAAYMAAGGDALHPGDEKEMMLMAVLDVICQAFAGIDNALRMDTLRYAVRDYLDIYGEKRFCYRIAAQKAKATLKITTLDTLRVNTLSAGTAFTKDGEIVFLLDKDTEIPGYARDIYVSVTCQEGGARGNALEAGDDLQIVNAADGVGAIVCYTAAAGGRDREDDESYRERIRAHGLSALTTGPAYQYEAAAKAVSSVIIDAKAISPSAGEVAVYILPSDDTGISALIDEVTAALSPEDARPLTDTVSVYRAVEKAYTLRLMVRYDGSTQTRQAVADAIESYKSWQEHTIGRAFDPDKLVSLVYQAGAERAYIDLENSEFDSGDAVYTEIPEYACCAGTVTTGEIS